MGKLMKKDKKLEMFFFDWWIGKEPAFSFHHHYVRLFFFSLFFISSFPPRGNHSSKL